MMNDTGQLTSDWVLTAPRLTSREEISERVARLESKIRDLARKTTTLEAELDAMEDALEHCGYDPTDCIDCGGPPHNEWCRFWKLRDVLPLLFALVEEEA